MRIISKNLVLIERIGSGGMAEVYRGKQTGFDGFEKTVAIKTIHAHLSHDPVFKNMFKTEANLTAKLQHPNIVQVYSSGEEEGMLYLVMEYVHGRNLADLLDKLLSLQKSFPIEMVCYICAQCADGLDYAYNYIDDLSGKHLELIHRDVNPANIMVSFKGEVKLVDFGIVKMNGNERTQTGVLKGKFSYMSPEQIDGESLDCRSDIFSLGVVLWEMLTHKRLFLGENDLKTIKNVWSCHVPAPSTINTKVSAELDAFVLKALSKDKNHRIKDAAEFSQDLLKILHKEFPNFHKKTFEQFINENFSEEIMHDKVQRKESESRVSGILANLKVDELKTSESKIIERTQSLGNQEITQVSHAIKKEESKLYKAYKLTPVSIKSAIALLVLVLSTIYGYKFYFNKKSLEIENSIDRQLASITYVKNILDQKDLRPEVLIPLQSNWKFFDKSLNIDEKWYQADFKEDDWVGGQSPLGYGEADIKTKLNYGSDSTHKLVSYYFRKKFFLQPGLIFYPQVLLRVKCDDGAVVYLNGEEISRINMPAGEIHSSTLASKTVAGADENIFLEIKFDKKFLKEGENIIAVELHQSSADSSDVRLDLQLIGAVYK